jgi:hypothetical protein
MTKMKYNEASAYNDKIKGHVEALNKLIKVVAKGGVKVEVSVLDDVKTLNPENPVPELKVETSIAL